MGSRWPCAPVEVVDELRHLLKLPSKEAYIRLSRGMHWASEACRLAAWSGDDAAQASWAAMSHRLSGYAMCLSHLARRRIKLGLEWPLQGGGQ